MMQRRRQQENVPLNSLVVVWNPVFLNMCQSFMVMFHLGLVVVFLASVFVRAFGSFHDDYFVTILRRARRTDSDLQHEVTYYHRKCTIMDVSIRPNIDYDKFDDLFVIFPSSSLEGLDNGDTSKGQKFQHRGRKRRRRRRFIPALYSWESSRLPPITKIDSETARRKSLSSMMKHGAVMIQQILTETTVDALREYLLQKNDLIQGTSAEYALSQGHNRISYGIEATEHDSVVRALKEIHDHPIFSSTIKNLVGDDNPALSEITAITVWAGAADQGWHPDVKPDGNGVMFGRTYSHSYSLFLPLQDTTESMGPTDLCAGTHYCADEDLWNICEENSIGLHEVRPIYTGNETDEGDNLYEYGDDGVDNIWRAGDGALLNQQVWHRGRKHVVVEGPDRVTFIVSFLRRPMADDPRQLARGTFFHQYWSNWFATWQDMDDSASSMKRPWNILRCLHLWKPSDRQWGYDLLSATSLRIANAQMGGDVEDLNKFIDNVMTPVKFPTWLQGSKYFESDNCWQVYLRETIRNTYKFLKLMNYVLHLGYILILLVVLLFTYCFNQLSLKEILQKQYVSHHIISRNMILSIIFTHVSVTLIGFCIWHMIRCSKWAKDIDSGITYTRPFPPAKYYASEDTCIQGGSTTLPRRSDVLIGTRYNTLSIGEYRNWLDYHPGNTVFDEFVSSNGASYYKSILGLASRSENRTFSRFGSSTFFSSLPDLLLITLVGMIENNGGRFLSQDYRNGNWRELSDAETKEYLHVKLFIGRGTVLASIDEELEFLLDKFRFGVSRNARTMSWISQQFLMKLRKRLFSRSYLVQDSNNPNKVLTTPSFRPKPILSRSNLASSSAGVSEQGIRKHLLRRMLPKFYPGTEVYLIDGEIDENGNLEIHDIFPGVIVDQSISNGIGEDENPVGYDIAFYDKGFQKFGTAEALHVPRNYILIRNPIKEGSRIEIKYDTEDDYSDSESIRLAGDVSLVRPDGSIHAKFDNDESIKYVALSQYNVLP